MFIYIYMLQDTIFDKHKEENTTYKNFGHFCSVLS